MSIKVLAIIAGISILLTIVMLVITSGPSNEPNRPVDLPEPTIVQLPTIDPRQPPAEGKAKITGMVCPISANQLDQGLTVVAEKIPSRERFTYYVSGPITQEKVYSLEVDPGIYEVFSELGRRRKIGLYSQFVVCGLSSSQCLDHALLQTEISANEIIENINICDYEWMN